MFGGTSYARMISEETEEKAWGWQKQCLKTYLPLAVKLEIFFWLESVGVWVLGHGLDALGNVEEDLLGA